jgi:hypothetical protein
MYYTGLARQSQRNTLWLRVFLLLQSLILVSLHMRHIHQSFNHRRLRLRLHASMRLSPKLKQLLQVRSLIR